MKVLEAILYYIIFPFVVIGEMFKTVGKILKAIETTVHQSATDVEVWAKDNEARRAKESLLSVEERIRLRKARR